MAWTGKIIGGVLGSLLGPLGAVVGVGIGHQFDKGASRVQSTAMAFQAAFFGCLAKMARADGKITQEEIRAVLEAFADRVERFEANERIWRRNNALHGLERLVVTVS